jgi:hypothetical protein
VVKSHSQNGRHRYTQQLHDNELSEEEEGGRRWEGEEEEEEEEEEDLDDHQRDCQTGTIVRLKHIIYWPNSMTRRRKRNYFDDTSEEKHGSETCVCESTQGEDAAIV